ncbi:zinc/iron permease [Candidatus Micrarchaeota archaeon]|nr:MAG: zinc/iron permease [Candidatus Micrarchaeota archaeon]
MVELTTLTWIAIFAIGAAIVNSIGIFAVYKNAHWVEKIKTYFMCFASGVLISTPLTFVLPTAVGKNPDAGFAALFGFLFMLFSNELIKRKTKQKSLAFGITAVEGIGIHSFVDGIIYAVTFSVSPLVGILSGIGLVIHEFAEGVITFSVVRQGGMRAEIAARYAFFVAALTTPIGAFIAYPFVSSLTSSILGLALGFVSGVLIYVSAAHLLPEAREHEKEHSLLAFLGGVALAIVLVFLEMA